ncbi:sodium:solute symporter family protein [Neisseria sp. Ec49-e6-T10]|uniref:sodium:solute symporter family protein n=1 Tax=Neisseria sp. Ec49-e6-T10 TaxID=3140744 RepID=UPI003EBF62B5
MPNAIFNNIPFLILCVYIICLFIISMYANRLAKGSTSAFLLAGRKITTPLLALNVAALAIGAASTVGVAESAYNTGLAAGWYNGAWAAGAIVMGLVAAGKYRRLGLSSLPELFDQVFGKESRLLSAIAILIVLMMITSLQYLAGGAILSSLLPEIFSFKSGMLVSAVVFISIALIGGLWSSGLSNILSITLIYLGVIIATILSVMNIGGLSELSTQLPVSDHWFSLKGTIPMAVLVGWFVVMITQTISGQATVQLACSAKNDKVAKRGFIWGGIIIFPVGFFCAVLGMVARVQFPDIQPTLALPQVILALPPILAGIVLSALWAADVSTACTILIGSSTLFTQDIFKRFVAPQSNTRTTLWISRLAIIFIGIITLILALHASDIVKTMMIGLSLTTAFTLLFLMVIFRPQWCRKSSATWTTLAGILVLALWHFIPAIPQFFSSQLPFFNHPIYLEWIICTLVFFCVPLFDQRKVSAISFPTDKQD